MSTYTSSRREFLRIMGQAGAVLAIGVGPAGSLLAGPRKMTLADGEGPETGLNNFILITPDNKITIFNPRPEMGQGTWQSVPALIAEELGVTFDQIDIRITSGEKRFGAQGVGGSSAVRESWIPMRQVGAAAREMLIKAAATRWKAAEADCYSENAKVWHRPSKKSLTFGELVADAAKLEVPKEPKLKDPKDFTIIGKPIPRPDVPLKVNGKAEFGIDVKVPGMLYATIQRCPVIHGKVVSFNESEVAAMPGVKAVFRTERKMPHKSVDAVAVVATNYWSALKARQALQIEWDNTGYENVSTEQYFAECRAKAGRDGNAYPDVVGDVKAGFAKAAKVLEAQYETPFTAHAPIEPMNATVFVQGNKAEVWAPVQGSTQTIEEVAAYLGIPQENVTMHTVFMGGSFGRKGYLDFVMEATAVSKKIQAPVKLIWTREDDLGNGPYRPGMLNAVKGGLDASGNLVAWEHKIIGASIKHQAFKEDVSNTFDDWASETADQATSPYAIPNRRQAFMLNDTSIPIVWWRSVYSSTNAFGQESFVDEMAHAAGKDPMDFRLEMLKNEPRWTALLHFLAEKSNYRALRKAGKAVGIAITHCFGSTAAYAVTVSKKDAGVVIENIVGVIDCGQYVNPDTVKAQTEGNAVMALSAALKPAITFADGQAQESNFHQFTILRLDETPPIEIHILESGEKPGGAGEPGFPPVAPALCNAIFVATGKRVRKLPFDLGNLV
ncbi:MAG TPA: molybdopterin-dependent oxidoreductase [Saprospiraceae bacterium]|nr:molybdopterin-dependent oxidoreductase [Saprospiraceae bacterium]